MFYNFTLHSWVFRLFYDFPFFDDLHVQNYDNSDVTFQTIYWPYQEDGCFPLYSEQLNFHWRWIFHSNFCFPYHIFPLAFWLSFQIDSAQAEVLYFSLSPMNFLWVLYQAMLYTCATRMKFSLIHFHSRLMYFLVFALSALVHSLLMNILFSFSSTFRCFRGPFFAKTSFCFFLTRFSNDVLVFRMITYTFPWYSQRKAQVLLL